MKKLFFIIFFLILSSNAHAGCDDPIADGVDYSKCKFSDGQDLQGTFLPNSNLSFASFIQVNFDKSIMMNSDLTFGTFSESSFIRANLYESNLGGGNFEQSNFTSANLTRVDFTGSTLIDANFQNSNLMEANFTSSNILNANFDGANLIGATWTMGEICGPESIGINKFVKNLLKLDGFEISFHEKSKRIINIKIEDQIIDRLVFPFKKFNITALEYKPFTRFTIAKSLDETASNKLSNFLNEIIKDRDTGCFIIGPKNNSSKIDQTFLVKLSTAITHLIGNPNHDSMAIES